MVTWCVARSWSYKRPVAVHVWHDTQTARCSTHLEPRPMPSQCETVITLLFSGITVSLTRIPIGHYSNLPSENCSTPSSVSGYDVVNAIRSVARPFGSVNLFKAYCELTETRALSRSELQSSGVSLTDCPHNGRKDVADKMILGKPLFFA